MKIVDIIYNSAHWGEEQLVAITEDSTEEFLFGYAPEEHLIPRSTLVGKTIEEAHKLKAQLDLQYLNSSKETL